METSLYELCSPQRAHEWYEYRIIDLERSQALAPTTGGLRYV